MSPISGTHLRLSCFGFSLTNTIFERAVYLKPALLRIIHKEICVVYLNIVYVNSLEAALSGTSRGVPSKEILTG